MAEAVTVALVFAAPAGRAEAPALEALRSVASAQGGEYVSASGSALMAAFDRSAEALSCAAIMQQAVANLEGGRPALKVGVNAGEVVREHGDLFGMAAVVARRLGERAEPGQVLLSGLVRGQVGPLGEHRFRDLGTLSVNGLADPLRTFELVWEREMAGAPPLAGAGGRSEEGGGAVPTEPEPGAATGLPQRLAAAVGRGFVGRSGELARLESLLERCRSGARGVCFVTGEPGVGKTRLAAELAHGASRRGWLVLYGHAHEGRVPPFGPFVEALGQWAASAPEEELRAAMEGGLAGELARLLPELARRLPEVAVATAVDPETARFRMFNAIRALLHRMAREAPLLLVLDDLHWADKATLFLLQHALRAPEESPLVVLGTYRRFELPEGSPLGTLLAELRGERTFESIALRGLREEDVGALVADWAGSEPAPELVRALHDETAGNPLFLRELLRHLLETGAIREDRGRLAASAQLETAGVPEGLREVIARRFGRLEERTRSVLLTAAVLGRQFPSEALRRATTLPQGELLGALYEAAGAGLLTGEPDGSYGFSHALVREVLYRGLPPTRRAQLHLQAATALEALHASDLDAHAGEIAEHLLRAGPVGDARKAIDYLELAARRASEQLAYEEAARGYERALWALDTVEERASLERGELLLGLGEGLARAGDREGARDAFRRAAAFARERGAPDQLARAAAGFASRFVEQPGVVDEPMIALLEEALEATEGERSIARVRLLAHLCGGLYYSARRERMGELSSEALRIAGRLGDPGALAYACSARHRALWEPEHLQERLAAATDLVRFAEDAGDRELALQGHGWLVVDMLELGDIEAVEAQLEVFEREAEELRQPLYQWNAAVWRAMRAILAGDLPSGERLAQEALAIGRQAESLTAPHYFAIQIMSIRRDQGRLGELEGVAEQYVAQFPTLPVWRAALALIYVERGRREEARGELERLSVGGFALLPRDNNWLTGIALLAEACAELGDAPRAAALYGLLLPYRHSAIVVALAAVCLGSASRVLGLLAAAMGRRFEAAQHFEHALELNERLGARPLLARSRLDYGRTLLARGAPDDRRRGGELLREAAALAEELGMEAVAGRARALAAGLSPESAPPP